MSEETEKLLREIAERLKSIEERLGLLLLDPNLDDDEPAASHLRMQQDRLAKSEREWESELLGDAHEEERDKESRESAEEFWRKALGTEPLPHIEDPEGPVNRDTGLTFCDLANRFQESLPINRKGRYQKMRKLFRRQAEANG